MADAQLSLALSLYFTVKVAVPGGVRSGGYLGFRGLHQIDSFWENMFCKQ